ncbi:hypothetical protein ACTWPB_25780 [Nocardia sp. IBHARD005]|uniref:hypothetical protein n=1 Tax=Nocardia sp. IBHARD005 TaxID=3457765 RepID=UPI00405972A9
MTDIPHTTPPARVSRALVFAVLCVLLSAVGHARTSGHPLSPSTLILAVAFATAFAWAAAGRQRGLVPIVTGLAAGQGLLHLWFAIDPAVAHSSHNAPNVGDDPAAMVAAHCLAAVLCGLWLWWGEHTTFALVRTVYARVLLPLLLLLLPDPDTGSSRMPARTRTTATRRLDPLRHCPPRRGPPSLIRWSPETVAAS